jgi:Rrf2 family protein
VRGARGGYQLARPAASISAADIIDAVEGPVALTECAGGAGNCDIETTCLVGHGWQRISRSIRRALGEVSLEALARRDAVFAAPDFSRAAVPARTPARG